MVGDEGSAVGRVRQGVDRVRLETERVSLFSQMERVRLREIGLVGPCGILGQGWALLDSQFST